MAEDNILYYGDNLPVLERHLPDESVDLIYLDPPFNSNATYNVLFGQADGTKAAAQIKAFDDTWHWDHVAAETFQDVVTAGGDAAQAMVAFRTLLGTSTMLAYLSMMAPRLIDLRRVLKPTGSIYLHCDPKASAHLRLLMDAIFGPKNFVNEIIWYYKTGGMSKRWFGRKHDVILFYAKGPHYKFAQHKEKSYLAHKYGFSNVTIEEDEGGYFTMVGMRDVWDIPALRGNQPEALGYPTQKPVAILERIIEASTDPGDVVLDPFCGCGTAVAASEKLGRRWIGIDIAYLAVSLIKSRLTAMGSSDYKVLGEPTTSEDAAQLAADDPYQFQWWALGLIGARPQEGKKGADKGIDGRLYFFDEGIETPKQVIVSVKAGKVQASHVRDLVGVLQREQAQIGLLISLNEPTQPMREEATSASFYKSPWGRHPTIQLLTVGELLDGKTIDMPAGGAHMTQVALPPVPEPTVHPDQLSLGA
jgi:site-specific DNA-methyltransferase (adenine-specific)